jgi:hypothetical protein
MPGAGTLLHCAFEPMKWWTGADARLSTIDYRPVPVSFTTAGPHGALWVTVTAPVMAPAIFGVKVMLKVHLAAAATVAPQGLVPDGAALKSPLATMLEMDSVPPELFVSVTVWGALVVPTVCAAKVRLAGARITGTTALPLTSTTCGLPAPEVASATAPLIVPAFEGVKVTDTVHLAEAASAPPQGVAPLPTAA